MASLLSHLSALRSRFVTSSPVIFPEFQRKILGWPWSTDPRIATSDRGRVVVVAKLAFIVCRAGRCPSLNSNRKAASEATFSAFVALIQRSSLSALFLASLGNLEGIELKVGIPPRLSRSLPSKCGHSYDFLEDIRLYLVQAQIYSRKSRDMLSLSVWTEEFIFLLSTLLINSFLYFLAFPAFLPKIFLNCGISLLS